jgi:MoaA/NifB/PqqE/SkfB family radical SAM enzyme
MSGYERYPVSYTNTHRVTVTDPGNGWHEHRARSFAIRVTDYDRSALGADAAQIKASARAQEFGWPYGTTTTVTAIDSEDI